MTAYTPDPDRVHQLARDIIHTEIAGAAITECVDSWAGDWPEHDTLGPADFAVLVHEVAAAMKNAEITINFRP